MYCQLLLKPCANNICMTTHMGREKNHTKVEAEHWKTVDFPIDREHTSAVSRTFTFSPTSFYFSLHPLTFPRFHNCFFFISRIFPRLFLTSPLHVSEWIHTHYIVELCIIYGYACMVGQFISSANFSVSRWNVWNIMMFIISICLTEWFCDCEGETKRLRERGRKREKVRQKKSTFIHQQQRLWCGNASEANLFSRYAL